MKTTTIIKKQRNYFILTSKSIMKLHWNQPLKLSPSWNQNKIKIKEKRDGERRRT